MRRVFRHAGLQGRVRLAFTDCLGPCSEANVICVFLDGRPVWLRRMNTIEPFAGLLDWLRAVLDDRARALPPSLAGREFAWTGSATGRIPPIDDR